MAPIFELKAYCVGGSKYHFKVDHIRISEFWHQLALVAMLKQSLISLRLEEHTEAMVLHLRLCGLTFQTGITLHNLNFLVNLLMTTFCDTNVVMGLQNKSLTEVYPISFHQSISEQ